MSNRLGLPKYNTLGFPIYETKLHAWNEGEFGDETPEALRGPWKQTTQLQDTATYVDFVLPDGTKRSVWIEVEDGDLRVRVYADDEVSQEPAGELRLKPGQERAEAVFD